MKHPRYCVLDSWDCYREQTLTTAQAGGTRTRPSYYKPAGKSTHSQRVAERNCDRLNKAHHEWLAS